MKLKPLMTIHAIFLIGLGIAFALYGPLMLAFFGIPDRVNSDTSYWQVATFARMFGAALFSFGLLLWAVRSIEEQFLASARRGILSALTLSNLMIAIVTATQQAAIWGMSAGWILTGVFALFTLAYGYLLFRNTSTNTGA
ncbi:MAG: hypothetical protein AB1894_19115 [Chloroflexota bacterium]